MSDKTIDHLSNDAAQARAHGMSYGKYMQWKAQNQNAKPIPVKRVAGENEAVCRQCGTVFPRSQHYRAYCSRLCRAEFQSAQKRTKRYGGGLGG